MGISCKYDVINDSCDGHGRVLVQKKHKHERATSVLLFLNLIILPVFLKHSISNFTNNNEFTKRS